MDESTHLVVLADLARRLREVLHELDLSQAEFARRVGVSQAFVSAVALAKSQPSIQMIAGMRAALGVSPDWFILGRGGMFLEPPEERPRPVLPPPDPMHLLLDQALASCDTRDVQRLRQMIELFVEAPARKRA